MKGDLLPKTYEYCLKMLVEIEKRQKKTDKVSCSLEHCGTGKSTLIKVILQAYEQAYERNPKDFEEGVIVVTDNLKRLADLAPTTAATLNLVNSANKNEIMPIANRKPNLLLTTQRWASMTRDDIQKLLTYYQNGTKRARTMVFFDEKPNLYTHLRINQKVLCNIRAALHDGLDESIPDDYKNFLIESFQQFHERITAALKEREISFSACLYRDEYNSITRNEAQETRFWALLDEYTNRLTLYDREFPKYKEGIRKLISNGAIYTSHKRKKDGEYEKSFCVGLDAREQFVDIGAKIFVLDATAKIDPLYDQDFIEFFPEYVPRTYNLKIICHDVNTSKNAIFASKDRELKKPAIRTREAIYQYLDEKFPNHDELAVFTYNDLVPDFENRGFKTTGYFGNLKGQNDYRDYQYLAHVGLNRYPYYVYLQILQATKPDVFEELAKKHCDEDIDNCKPVQEAIAEICQNAVLSDLIQNICRICIRSGNEKKAVVMLFYGRKKGQYPNLHNELQDYFRGATIEMSNEVSSKVSCNRIRDRQNPNGKSIAQKILEWIDNKQSEFEFSVQDLTKAVGITQNQFNDCKKGNAALRKKLSSIMVEGRRGFYKLP